MIEKEFFIEILKATPSNSFVETTGFVDYNTAVKLGLVSFDSFVPSRVGLTFNIDKDNVDKWVDFFNNSKISDLITHYWIYNDDKVIASGFDYFEFNLFDPDFYVNTFDKYSSDFEIKFETNLTNGLPKQNRTIEILKVSDYNGNYSADIIIEINGEILNLRFAIEQIDYDNISKLIKDLQSDDKLIFKGVYLSSKDFQEFGITIKKVNIEIDLIINSTRRLISNLLWFQGLDNKNEIKKLIINCP